VLMIRAYTPADEPGVLAVAEDLPEWFTPQARQVSIPIDLRHQVAFVAAEEGVVVGFISLYVSEGKLTIGWLGVLKRRHRNGIGRKLLGKAEETARVMGVAEVAVSTLGDKVQYAPYDQTRRFYLASGFAIYQRHQTDNPECPEEIKLSKKV
jgi:GNAT superfamily N-acetyltransferase